MSLLLSASKKKNHNNWVRCMTSIAKIGWHAIAVVVCAFRLRILVLCGAFAAHQNMETTMTVNKETEAEILRLHYAEKWRPTTIATTIGIHHSTVQRVLANNGLSYEHLRVRSSKADPYIGFIRATLDKYPRLTAARLHDMVKERGYDGAASRFREVVARLRPRPVAEAYLRTATLPGEQAQCDWAHFGKVRIGNAERRLLAFVMVLSWSRHIFLRFYTGDAMPNFLRGHTDAFKAWGAVPREILYDNLRSAVLERYGSAIRFNPQLLELAAHYHFQPKPTGVRMPQQKGRVERAIQYIRGSFFAARQWSDLDDLNNQAAVWCVNTAGTRRCPENGELTVLEAFEKEKPSLLALPDNPYPAYERKDVKVGKTPYARFDMNDYSVDYRFVQQTLTVMATPDTVEIFKGSELVGRHRRCYDKGQQIECATHLKELEEHKQAAHKHRAIDRLRHAAPSAKELLNLAAERGHNLGRLTQQLTEMLDLYGPAELEAAIKESIGSDSPHASAVRQVLEIRRSKRGLPPPVNLQFGTNSQATSLVVTPKSLDSYDELLK
jgi:transposase